MQEERGTGRAKGLDPVEVSENDLRRLKSIAATRIRPMVAGIETVALTANDGASAGVVVPSVPPSADTPHTIGSQHRIGIPYRYGSDTHWMTERELERAYAERFRRRTAEDQRLGDLVASTAPHPNLENRSWVAAVASPRAAQDGVLTRLSRREATSRLQAALETAHEMLPPGDGQRYTLIRDLGNAALNPRVGIAGLVS